MKNELVACIDDTYTNNPIPSHYGTILIIDHNQHYLMDAPVVWNFDAPSYTQPTINKTTQQDPQVIGLQAISTSCLDANELIMLTKLDCSWTPIYEVPNFRDLKHLTSFFIVIDCFFLQSWLAFEHVSLCYGLQEFELDAKMNKLQCHVELSHIGVHLLPHEWGKRVRLNFVVGSCWGLIVPIVEILEEFLSSEQGPLLWVSYPIVILKSKYVILGCSLLKHL